METAKSKYWLDIACQQIQAAHPSGELIVESGHSPSGNYHVGFLREAMIASAIAGKLQEQGRQAKHVDFVDDFDVFRKLPANVPSEWEQYIGQPLRLVPDPFGDCHDSYADHFLAGLYESLAALGAEFESMRSFDEYRKGTFTTSIELSLSKLDQAKEIIAEVSHRQLDDDWSPVQILSQENSLRDWRYTGWDQDKQTVQYKSADGQTGEVSYADGRVKLDWRLDWPARWALLKISAEPFGRDHASKGGSYETGSVLVREIFGGQAPLAVPYEFVNLVGQNKKMSKSAGNVITPADALEIMPPEIVRYFLGKARPAKTLFFDSGIGLYNLIDEFARVEADIRADRPNEFGEAYQFASSGKTKQTISSVPFSHLVAVYQAAQSQSDQVFKLLERTGYESTVKTERPVIESELIFVKNWLDKYAPVEVKFNVQKTLPQVELSDTQAKFLDGLATKLETMDPLVAQAIHETVYEVKDAVGLGTGEAFQAIYRIILGQDSGPKAGWFLATFDRDWLIRRLRRTT